MKNGVVHYMYIQFNIQIALLYNYLIITLCILTQVIKLNRPLGP